MPSTRATVGAVGAAGLIVLSLGASAVSSRHHHHHKPVPVTTTSTAVVGTTSTTVVSNKTATVTRVVDGDTFVIGGDIKVRLIGVNTPETVAPHTPVQCYGPEASDYVKHLLRAGTQVRLVGDVAPLDKYGRELDYVWRVSDNLFVNDDLVAKGYARADPVAPDLQRKAEFAMLQQQAQSKSLGLWGACGAHGSG